MDLKYYTFDQNNSGGVFDFDAEKGISIKVIVQARDPKEANYLATRIGLYFNGEGDCECCGTRWSEQYSWNGNDDGTDTPMIYGDTAIEDWIQGSYFTRWMGPDQPEVFVHKFDGTFTGYVYGEHGNVRMNEAMS